METKTENKLTGISAKEAKEIAAKRLLELSALSKSIAARLKHERFDDYLKGIPKQYVRAWFEAYTGNASHRKCIAAKCRDCVGYEDTVQSIKLCKSYHCALWNVRPYQIKDEDENDQD